MSAKIRVVIADDHPLIRAGIRGVLDDAADIEVVEEAADGEAALEAARRVEPDVLLLDVEMPRMEGIEVARQLVAEGSSVRILALSAHDDEQYVFGLLEAGAAGYLVKDEVPATIADAVRGVARGEDGWLSRRIAARLMKRRTAGGGGTDDAVLSDREREVLGLVAAGLDNQEIGERLFIAENTVKSHCYSIYAKIGVKNRVQAAAWAWRRGLSGPV
ncbi:MAG: response regulator transcription factor [Rhodothermales bacterium]|nr:response regulator transcription factor [Rhodothermales bacterium]MBO6778707.1 response regulator transcription factor [Rhodothermales bacterium]